MLSKAFWKIFLFSVLLHIFVIPFRAGWAGIHFCSLIGFVAYFLLTTFCLKKYQTILPVGILILALFTGRCFLDLPVIVSYFTGETWSLPDLIVHTLGIICGFLFVSIKSPLKILPPVFGLIFAVFMFFQGYDYWLSKRNFGTFTGRVTPYQMPQKFEAFDEQKNLITNSDFQNKIVLLDFWHTTCGVCFKKFPRVQFAHDVYKNDSSVLIYAVNKPIEEDYPNQAFEMIREKGYLFSVIIAKDAELPEMFGIKGYPTTFVINRNGMIVYKGDIEGAIKMIEELKTRG